MKTLYSKFDKKLISALPRALFEGRIFVIQTEAEASRAVDYLLASAVLGVDTETRPSFRKGCTNKVALLQVSTDDTCFLFRLNHIGVTESVKRLLQDENVLKVGLSLRDDFASLHKRGEFEPRAFLDLQDYVRAFGIEDMSLQKLYANIFGQKISKGQRLTNWEADVLTEGQKLYAATDAWACIRLYRELETLKENNDYELISALPRALFEGRIFVIQTEAEASRAVDYLLASAVLGVDTETRPSFRKGCTNKVALLQVSTDDTCFLFRLNHIGVTESVKRLLQDENVLKVGLSLRDDFASLHKRGEFEPRAFLDLQDYVRAFGIEDMSLQKLYANIFGQKISKGQRLTNWEADVLTEGQKLYAATDAWACIRLYRELETLKENNDYELAVVQES